MAHKKIYDGQNPFHCSDYDRRPQGDEARRAGRDEWQQFSTDQLAELLARKTMVPLATWKLYPHHVLADQLEQLRKQGVKIAKSRPTHR